MSYIVVLTTLPNKRIAAKIADKLVMQKAVACVNVLPSIESRYIWKGKRTCSKEVLIIIKTTTKAYPRVEKIISQNHPYELPEIIALPISKGLPAYLSWIAKAVA